METFDTVTTYLGIVYGILLIASTFVRNRLTEALRIDALILPRPTQATRGINLVFGVVIIGYMVYSAFFR